MWNSQKSAVCLLLVLAYLSMTAQAALELTEVKPEQISVKEGEDVKLHCAVNMDYEWCNFTHNGQLCDFAWTRAAWNVTTLTCDDFNGRIEFNYEEDSKVLYDNHICEITLKSVTLEDQGIWNCNLESYHNGRYRGYGWQIQGQMLSLIHI